MSEQWSQPDRKYGRNAISFKLQIYFKIINPHTPPHQKKKQRKRHHFQFVHQDWLESIINTPTKLQDICDHKLLEFSIKISTNNNNIIQD